MEALTFLVLAKRTEAGGRPCKKRGSNGPPTRQKRIFGMYMSISPVALTPLPGGGDEHRRASNSILLFALLSKPCGVLRAYQFRLETEGVPRHPAPPCPLVFSHRFHRPQKYCCSTSTLEARMARTTSRLRHAAVPRIHLPHLVPRLHLSHPVRCTWGVSRTDGAIAQCVWRTGRKTD